MNIPKSRMSIQPLKCDLAPSATARYRERSTENTAILNIMLRNGLRDSSGPTPTDSSDIGRSLGLPQIQSPSRHNAEESGTL